MDGAPSPNILFRIAGWFVAFGAMPGRIKILAEAAAADRDPRPKCTACGKGRVSLASMTNGEALGRCDECGIEWKVSQKGDQIYRLSGGAPRKPLQRSRPKDWMGR